MSKLAPGCCSAINPCSHQQRDPSTLCATCQNVSRREDLKRELAMMQYEGLGFRDRDIEPIADRILAALSPKEEPTGMTPEKLVELLRAGKKMRPLSWAKAGLLSDGYCHIETHNTFVQYTPATVGSKTSPAIAGARQAIDRYGDQWEEVTEPSLVEQIEHVLTERETISHDNYGAKKAIRMLARRDDLLRQALEAIHYAEGTAQANIDRANEAETRLDLSEFADTPDDEEVSIQLADGTEIDHMTMGALRALEATLHPQSAAEEESMGERIEREAEEARRLTPVNQQCATCAGTGFTDKGKTRLTLSRTPCPDCAPLSCRLKNPVDIEDAKLIDDLERRAENAESYLGLEAGQLSVEDAQLLIRLKRDNIAGGTRPVIESDMRAWEQARRLSKQGLIAIEQMHVGGALHITLKGSMIVHMMGDG